MCVHSNSSVHAIPCCCKLQAVWKRLVAHSTNDIPVSVFMYIYIYIYIICQSGPGSQRVMHKHKRLIEVQRSTGVIHVQ